MKLFVLERNLIQNSHTATCIRNYVRDPANQNVAAHGSNYKNIRPRSFEESGANP
jgi:hypothetical protein